LYESALRSFSLVTFWPYNFWHQIFLQTLRVLDLDEIEGRWRSNSFKSINNKRNLLAIQVASLSILDVDANDDL